MVVEGEVKVDSVGEMADGVKAAVGVAGWASSSPARCLVAWVAVVAVATVEEGAKAAAAKVAVAAAAVARGGALESLGKGNVPPAYRRMRAHDLCRSRC
jgi:hypothetical protein